MPEITLEILQKELSDLFHFEIDLKKSLNIDYNLDGEEVIDVIDTFASK